MVMVFSFLLELDIWQGWLQVYLLFFLFRSLEGNLRRWIRLFRDNQIESTCWYEHPPAVSTCVALTYHTRFCSTISSTCSTDGDDERLWVGYTNTKTSSVVKNVCTPYLAAKKNWNRSMIWLSFFMFDWFWLNWVPFWCSFVSGSKA